ncbi:uncharacterized protein BT62DRAFT_1014199 [Guyanagaster necrorhizus]|uniref:Uncharacterized protein n=1 Tax=Guyanagaster necrorhizus TaxID=856835 RepID=A0A9P7VFW2_9AGAR|nr:uncharacterized protein BT62DRAFT_1014199 [Guyanagaster necrorhizus MCA 3950]KAG7439244.1 hypothetical protein BT62DRAFT_1014199 [Guyanagaster necrorhizus MCA 3950]
MPRTVESLIKENERLSESSEWNATGLDDQRRRKDRKQCLVAASSSPASEDIMHESAEKAIVRNQTFGNRQAPTRSSDRTGFLIYKDSESCKGTFRNTTRTFSCLKFRSELSSGKWLIFTDGPTLLIKALRVCMVPKETTTLRRVGTQSGIDFMLFT